MARVYFEGASIAALTAAARLNKAKYETVINGAIYQNTKIGSFEFDSAPLFTLPAVYRDFFQKTGRHFGQILEVKAPEFAFVFHFSDLKINFANLSRNARLAELSSKLGEDAAFEWDREMRKAELLWDRIREDYFEWEFKWRNFKLPDYLQLTKPQLKNPYLRKILSHYATYLGYPAGIYKWSHLVAFVEESFGVWQIKGGEGALHAALKERALETGTKFSQLQGDCDYFIDATETHSRPSQRLLGISKFPQELPIRSVHFHDSGLTSDLYATEMSQSEIAGKLHFDYALVITGALDFLGFEGHIQVDEIRAATQGSSDNQVLTKIRTTAKNRFRIRHMDSLSHAGVCGELLANAVRGIKNRPSHEH